MKDKIQNYTHLGALTTGIFHMQKRYATQRPRGTSDWLLIYTLGGCGRFDHARGQLLVGNGELVMSKPHTPHDYGLEDRLRRWDLVWAHFQPLGPWLAWLNWPEVAPGLMHLKVNDAQLRRKIAERFKQVHHLHSGYLRRAESFALN